MRTIWMKCGTRAVRIDTAPDQVTATRFDGVTESDPARCPCAVATATWTGATGGDARRWALRELESDNPNRSGT